MVLITVPVEYRYRFEDQVITTFDGDYEITVGVKTILNRYPVEHHTPKGVRLRGADNPPERRNNYGKY